VLSCSLDSLPNMKGNSTTTSQLRFPGSRLLKVEQ
jgi:hypothetical protein